MADKEYGVDDLAKIIKKSPAVVRALLRDSKVKKEGKSYTWSSQTALQAAAKKLGGSAPTAKKAAPKKSAVKAKKTPKAATEEQAVA